MGVPYVFGFFFSFSLKMLHHSLNQHTQPFILAREFSFRTMSFYRFAVRTVPPTALLFPWMLWEIIESAVYGAVCRGAPTSMCLVNTVSLKSPPWAVGSGFLTVPRCQPSLETRAQIKNSNRSFIAAPADAGGFWSIFEFCVFDFDPAWTDSSSGILL